ncbi:MAG: GDP-mannose 4,6-dehydratase [Candidatus Nitrosocosmicus sp.]|nr:GDP-mannose 4,6-dehydratase [Candidatus Nitrosocosmicus sp.]
MVTGEKGFVGTHLIKQYSNRIKIANENFAERLNILDTENLKKIGKVDAVVHLASRTSIPNSIRNPSETYYSNIIGTLNILEYLRNFEIDRIINISTYVYGSPVYLPIDENHPINPHSPYNKSKVISEDLCEYYSKDYNINVVTLRPFYIYGSNGNPNFLIPSILRQITEKQVVTISRENTKRDFLFIDDFLELIGIILNNFPTGYNVFNVGYGQSHSIEEIVNMIAEINNIKIPIEIDKLLRPNDITEMIADITKVNKFFGWSPKTDLRTGLEKTILN